MKLKAIKFVLSTSVGCYVGGELNFITVSHDWKHWIHENNLFQCWFYRYCEYWKSKHKYDMKLYAHKYDEKIDLEYDLNHGLIYPDPY